MKRDNINQIANLLGVSGTTIRNYEKKGLIKSTRNMNNNYREFDTKMVGTLIYMRQLRQSGFSLKDIDYMMNYADTENVRQKIKQRKKELDEQISKCEALKRTLDKWLDDMDNIDGNILLCTMPSLRYTKYMDTRDGIVDNCEKVQKYLKEMPFSFPAVLIPKAEFCNSEKEDYDFSVGIVSTLESEISHDENEIFISEGPCYIFSCRADELQHFGSKIFQEVRTLMKADGMKLRGAVLAKITHTMLHKNPKGYKIWLRFYIPVSNIE